MKTNRIIALLLALITVLSLAACTSETEKNPDGTETNAVSDHAGTDTPSTDPREAYTVSEEEKAVLAEEKTEKAIEYVGFESHSFVAPAKTTDAGSPSVVTAYSTVDVENFIKENSDKYELDGVAEAVKRYDLDYFMKNALLFITFREEDGAASYTVTGAWKDTLEGDGFELEELVMAAKRNGTGSKNADVVLIVELSRDFAKTWDSFYISLYE